MAMSNAEITCPACGNRFLVPNHALEDDLGRPVGEDKIARMHDCPDDGREANPTDADRSAARERRRRQNKGVETRRPR